MHDWEWHYYTNWTLGWWMKLVVIDMANTDESEEKGDVNGELDEYFIGCWSHLTCSVSKYYDWGRPRLDFLASKDAQALKSWTNTIICIKIPKLSPTCNQTSMSMNSRDILQVIIMNIFFLYFSFLLYLDFSMLSKYTA